MPGVKALADALALVPNLTILDLGCVCGADIQLRPICRHDFPDLENLSQHYNRTLLTCNAVLPKTVTSLLEKYCSFAMLGVQST